jgi:hypothetical protein
LALHAIDRHRIRDRGVTLAASEAVAHLARDDGPDHDLWLHVHADVLDDAIIPAVDYRLSDGFSWEAHDSNAYRHPVPSSRRAGGHDLRPSPRPGLFSSRWSAGRVE